MKISNFNWRSMSRYLSPQAADDLNAFLEQMPQKAGQSALIAAGIVWAAAGAIGLYTTVQVQSLAEKRTELQEMEAVKPTVPEVRNLPESASTVSAFVDNARDFYPDLEMRANGSSVVISSRDTRHFWQFREAVGHTMNGGRGWRVNVENMCVGRGCDNDQLVISLVINKVSID